MVTTLLLCGIAASLSVFLTFVVQRVAPRLGAIDCPTDRKMHDQPIPRLGGVAVIGAIVGTFLLGNWLGLLSQQSALDGVSSWGPLLAGGAVIFLCGVWDDLSPLSARNKLLAQLVGAALVVGSGVSLDRIAFAGDYSFDLGWLSLPLTVLWIVGVTNAFNLIDGLDGLSAGLGSIAAGTCAAIFLYSGATEDATVLFILLGALVGFLPFNFYPAKIFLGDSGSLVLGYILAVTVITGSQKYATSTAVIIPLLTLGVPIIDTLLSMVRRLFGRPYRDRRLAESRHRAVAVLSHVFAADRDHIHHRLMAHGFSHRGAVLTLYATAGALSMLALLSVLAHYRNAILLLLTVAVATAIGIGKLGYLDASVSRLGSAFEQVDRPNFDRSFFFGFADLLLISMAYWGAYALLIAGSAAPSVQQWHLNTFPLVALVQISILWLSGLYRGVWRAVGVGDLMRVAVTVCAGGALSFSIAMVSQAPEATGSLFVVYTLLLGWLMGGLRSAYRLIDYSQFRAVPAARPALIYGAGLGGRLLLRELRQNPSHRLHAVGFIDDHRSLRNRIVSGIPVLGTGKDLHTILSSRYVHALLVSSHAIQGPVLQRALETCLAEGVRVERSVYLLEPLSKGHMPESRAERDGVEDRSSQEIRRLRNAIASLRRAAV